MSLTNKIYVVIILTLVMLILFAGCLQTPQHPQNIAENKTEDIVKEQTKKITEEITKQEVERITKERTEQITAEITKRETERIAKELYGMDISKKDSQLKEAECDRAPITRQFSTSPYYTGPLVDSHVHMPSAFKIPSEIASQVQWDPPVLDQDVTKSDLICLLDKENASYAFGFYIITNLLTQQSVDAAKDMEVKYPKRVVAFITPSHLSSLDAPPGKVRELLSSNKELFKGYGELAFYKGQYKFLSPDDQQFMEIYKIADEYNLIVMIHPDSDNKQAVENILQDYPNVIFLFHGEEMESYVTEIIRKYPNAYYTIDGPFSDITGEHESVNLYGSGSKEQFISDFKRDYDTIVNNAITKWKDPVEKYPDRFLWGTDRAYAWHFDPEVGALIQESSRSFIGQLDDSAQEKFAYKNAERILKER